MMERSGSRETDPLHQDILLLQDRKGRDLITFPAQPETPDSSGRGPADWVLTCFL